MLAPLRLVSVCRFDQGLLNVKVASLDDAIGPGIVSRDSDVIDMVPCFEVVQSGYKRFAVVRNKLGTSAIST